MPLQEEQTKQIVSFVKKEPRTVQDIAQLLGKSWLTADSYVKQIKERTGLINIKTFRKGTQGALKLVFYNYSDSLATDDVKEELYQLIKSGRRKTDFDFMDIFQFVPQEKKKVISQVMSVKESVHFASLLKQAKSNIYFFSGNLSFLNLRERGTSMIEVIEELLGRKIRLKIICRVDAASINNLAKLDMLLKKFPDLIEIRHSYQPLRGFIVDDSLARFSSEALVEHYKEGELQKDIKFFYEIFDSEWIDWLQKVFWNIFRFSIDHNVRLNEIRNSLAR